MAGTGECTPGRLPQAHIGDVGFTSCTCSIAEPEPHVLPALEGPVRWLARFLVSGKAKPSCLPQEENQSLRDLRPVGWHPPEFTHTQQYAFQPSDESREKPGCRALAGDSGPSQAGHAGASVQVLPPPLRRDLAEPGAGAPGSLRPHGTDQRGEAAEGECPTGAQGCGAQRGGKSPHTAWGRPPAAGTEPGSRPLCSGPACKSAQAAGPGTQLGSGDAQSWAPTAGHSARQTLNTLWGPHPCLWHRHLRSLRLQVPKGGAALPLTKELGGPWQCRRSWPQRVRVKVEPHR